MEAEYHDNKAMAFLKKIGRVGGASNKDYTNVLGIDEGPSGKSMGSASNPLMKSSAAYRSSTEPGGEIDNLSEPFPTTSSGSRWTAFTDRVMGGVSIATLAREVFDGRVANVLRGKVSLKNNGGFIQMATDLVASMGGDVGCKLLDASHYDGIELDLQCQGQAPLESFNVHLKNQACSLPFSSYRASIRLPTGIWERVRIPWSEFRGYGPGAADEPFRPSSLKRVGIVAIGKEMNVAIALSSIKFYRASHVGSTMLP